MKNPNNSSSKLQCNSQHNNSFRIMMFQFLHEIFKCILNSRCHYFWYLNFGWVLGDVTGASFVEWESWIPIIVIIDSTIESEEISCKSGEDHFISWWSCVIWREKLCNDTSRLATGSISKKVPHPMRVEILDVHPFGFSIVPGNLSPNGIFECFLVTESIVAVVCCFFVLSLVIFLMFEEQFVVDSCKICFRDEIKWIRFGRSVIVVVTWGSVVCSILFVTFKSSLQQFINFFHVLFFFILLFIFRTSSFSKSYFEIWMSYTTRTINSFEVFFLHIMWMIIIAQIFSQQSSLPIMLYHFLQQNMGIQFWSRFFRQC